MGETLKNLLTRSIAFVLRLNALFGDEPLRNVAPYGTCDIAQDALSSWLETGSVPQNCLSHQNRTRCWYTYTPNSVVDSTSEVPLVVHLHGAGGCASLPAMGWGNIAEDSGVVMIWPAGTPTLQPGIPDAVNFELSTWNDGSGLFGAEAIGIDDIGFLEKMLDIVLSNDDKNYPNIDSNRVYISGHSNGAVMAQRFALQTNGIVAGVVAVAGAALPEDPEWSPGGNVTEFYQPTPILLISGQVDNVVPFNERRGPLAGAIPSLNGWADINGCPSVDATVEEYDDYIQHIFTGCGNGTEVALLEVKEAGHHPFSKGEGEFQISPFNIIADCPFRGIPFFYEPDCQLIDLDTTRLAWEFISAFQLN